MAGTLALKAFLIAAYLATVLLPPTTAAQARPEPVRVEFRVDGFSSARPTPATVHLGAGLARRIGMTQLALLAGAGPSSEGLTGRIEGAARFHIDPYRERRLGLYGAAGGGVLWSDSTQAYLLVLLGVEGRRSSGGWSAFAEAGLSRGARIAAGFRRTPASRR